MSVVTSRAEDVVLTNDNVEAGVLSDLPIHLLPLRAARGKYAMVKGVNKGKQSPELYDIKMNEIYPLCQVARHHGACAEDDKVYHPVYHTYTRENMYRMGEKSQATPWVFVGISDECDTSPVLEHLTKNTPSPICVFTYDGFREANMSGTSPYYTRAYANMERISLLTGLYGTMHMNTSVNLNLEDNPLAPNIEKRHVRSHQHSFYCSGHTAHSGEAGILRRLAYGVEIRLWSRAEWMTMSTVLESLIEQDPTSTIVLSIGGLYCRISDRSMIGIKSAYRDGRLSLATLHYKDTGRFRCLYVDVTPGVLIRKVDNTYYDSANMPRDLPKTMSNSFSTFFLTVPFILRNRPPRTLIASCQSIQGVCHPFLYQSSVFRPTRATSPIVTTSFYRDHKIDTKLVPGENLCIGLININENYEDCFLMSKAALDRGIFEYTVTTVITIDIDSAVREGATVTMDTHSWWCLPFPAKVVKADVYNSDQMRVTLERTAVPTDGDKMATLHGQKGVVKVIPRHKMPRAVSPEGKVQEFDLVIAISSVISRVTVGQVFELRAGRLGYEKHKSTGVGVVDADLSVEDIMALPTYHVLDVDTGEKLYTPEGRPVMCEWGYGRVQLLHHLTAGKHHFTRVPNSRYTKYTSKGRVGGGSIKVGDMEMEALVSSGLTLCAQELAMRRDMSIVSVCTKCNRQCSLCDCPTQYNDTRRMLIPYATVNMDHAIFASSGMSFEYYANRQ